MRPYRALIVSNLSIFYCMMASNLSRFSKSIANSVGSTGVASTRTGSVMIILGVFVVKFMNACSVGVYMLKSLFLPLSAINIFDGLN